MKPNIHLDIDGVILAKNPDQLVKFLDSFPTPTNAISEK